MIQLRMAVDSDYFVTKVDLYCGAALYLIARVLGGPRGRHGDRNARHKIRTGAVLASARMSLRHLLVRNFQGFGVKWTKNRRFHHFF